jgi:NAD-dependent SIR2 family protein deacetylase
MNSDQQIETIRANLETSLKAIEEYELLGEVKSVSCEQCKQVIKIEPLGNSARKMTCKCGLYNDTLRGL